MLAYDKARDNGFNSDDFLVSYAKACQGQGEVEHAVGQREVTERYFECAIKHYNTALMQWTGTKDFIYYNLGKIFFFYEKWLIALQYYQLAGNFNRYKADAYLEAGRTHVELENYEEALKCFERARSCYRGDESDLGEANVETACGDAYSHIAESSDSKDNYYAYYKQADKYYQHAVRIYDQHAKAYLGLGKTYVALHYDPETAIGFFDRALELNPQLTECYFLKGKCYYALRKPLEAYAMYGMAVKKGLNGALLQIACGEALLNMDRYSEALQSFDAAIKFENLKQAHPYCGKGTALYRMELYDDALQAFEDANNINDSICSRPQYKSVLQDISVYFDKRSHDKPQDPFVYINKGKALLLLRDQNQEAINAYTMAITFGGASAYVYICRGLAYERLQKYQKAFDDYTEALNIDPNYLWVKSKLKSVESKIAQPQTSFWQKIRSWLKLSN